MIIEKYKMIVTTDVIHGWKTDIIEYWISPKKGKHKGIVFNFCKDHDEEIMSCWFENKPRYIKYPGNGEHIDNIQFSDKDADDIYEYLKRRCVLNVSRTLKSMRKVDAKDRAEMTRARLSAFPVVDL